MNRDAVERMLETENRIRIEMGKKDRKLRDIEKVQTRQSSIGKKAKKKCA
jgi:hypothetical protein